MENDPDSSYAAAGVDLDLAQRAKAGLSSAVASTATPLTLDAFGSFGGVIRIPEDIPDPAIVASIDGVGTKLHLAIEVGRAADAGRDLVNHCLNDVAVQNARPIAFLDYVAADRLDPAVLTSLVQGMASACRAAGVSIVGGETALMPDTYAPGRYDAVGAVIGVASAGQLPNPATVTVGDVCIGLPSSGPHTNGYSPGSRAAQHLRPHDAHRRPDAGGRAPGPASLVSQRTGHRLRPARHARSRPHHRRRHC